MTIPSCSECVQKVPDQISAKFFKSKYDCCGSHCYIYKFQTEILQANRRACTLKHFEANQDTRIDALNLREDFGRTEPPVLGTHQKEGRIHSRSKLFR